ncbi:MAG TPA: NAD(P)/FAD-dependent oxidoreductase, partial [Mycobacterium sp.]|nr:NAD(P)/FAD-dependent oxidoreductase [Mycobacterium sp.]
MARAHTCQAMIIGAGSTGIGAAIKLAQAGIKADGDIVILERSERIGGTAPADKVCQHADELADRFDMRRHIRFGSDVTGLSFDENTGVWTASTATTSGCTSSFCAHTLVVTSGRAPDLGFPDICGLDSYTGHKIHGVRWDHDYDFTGKRVGVVDAGAGAVQIVPELVNRAKFVKLFQRTPSWVLPRPDVAIPPALQKLFAEVPAIQHLLFTTLFRVHQANSSTPVRNTLLTVLATQLAKAHLRVKVKDPWLRRQLTPSPVQDRKRMLISSDYYPALQRDNCKLIDWPIATLSPAGVRTSDGIEHRLDCIVFATGYDVHLTGPPFPVTGLGGRSLAADWADGAQAYKSINAHGYPNLFFMTGPNSGPGHNSLLVYIEGQLDYAVRGITTILDNDLRYLDVREDVQRRHNESIQ